MPCSNSHTQTTATTTTYCTALHATNRFVFVLTVYSRIRAHRIFFFRFFGDSNKPLPLLTFFVLLLRPLSRSTRILCFMLFNWPFRSERALADVFRVQYSVVDVLCARGTRRKPHRCPVVRSRSTLYTNALCTFLFALGSVGWLVGWLRFGYGLHTVDACVCEACDTIVFRLKIN